MKKSISTLVVFLVAMNAYCQQDSLQTNNREAINKEIARNFYQDLWFTNHTDKYSEYVADEYMIHDIFDRKDNIEKAIVQKEIADRFWEHGKLSGEIDFQIADGDLVATRWKARFEPDKFPGHLYGMEELAIINVFRINNESKIVEIWNHRHDIETNRTMMFTIKGLLIGLLIALIPTIFAFRLRRKLKALK
jgi:predicted SnoaL-like aldol condensation-catalyzing enzyme